MQTTRTLIFVAGAAAVAVALAACGGGGGQPSTSSPAGQAATTMPSTSNADSQGLLRAGETAQGDVADSTVVSIESERHDAQWKVHVVTSDGTEHRVELSADGSKVISGPTEKPASAADKAENLRRVDAAKLDYREAVPKVTQAVPGRISELELDSKEGTIVWEADVVGSDNTKHKVQIDAGSGNVLKQN